MNPKIYKFYQELFLSNSIFQAQKYMQFQPLQFANIMQVSFRHCLLNDKVCQSNFHVKFVGVSL